MSLIDVTSVTAQQFNSPLGEELVVITVSGNLPTSGWGPVNLSPYIYISDPSDGVWDFGLIAKEPVGMVLQVIEPFELRSIVPKLSWLKAVRINASKSVMAPIELNESLKYELFQRSQNRDATRSLISQQLASYDDSIQPTGTIHWKNDGPFGLPVPHPEMKKLTHSIIITVDGPDESKVRECLSRAFTSATIAAILAALISGGMAAASAFFAAGTESLKSCLGDELISVNIVDDSHWVFWDV
ncbi:hypothetical protein M979_1673 [Buttiauxella noackiae ATCC 51607]|uniref:Uncharacterized protein n=1 Tax=Buttiauxella noackiae ATCC 51607 TaxID=1354255 RepID=A0A1B7HT82_9ENTR|nr:hypothetical protein [Buttiauxella noackiae]OAT18849.1 hypothetical protein M979_1673 [Buttiauxella noackiae ATCC 51607]